MICVGVPMGWARATFLDVTCNCLLSVRADRDILNGHSKLFLEELDVVDELESVQDENDFGQIPADSSFGMEDISSFDEPQVESSTEDFASSIFLFI